MHIQMGRANCVCFTKPPEADAFAELVRVTRRELPRAATLPLPATPADHIETHRVRPDRFVREFPAV